MEKVRLGIIGIGNMGSSHITNIEVHKSCPEITVTAVADINPARLDWVKENIGTHVALFDDAEKMMDSGLVDAILIAVPHYFHPVYAIKAFERGLHVMSEKPAGVYTKQVKEMNEAAKKAGVVFGMMFNQRTNHIYRKMKEIVESGELGEIKRTNWIITNWYRPQAYYDSGAWRATWSGEGGGVLLNQCPHNLDLWQWICGMPVLVDTHMHFGKWHDIEVEDDVSTYVEYANGATGVFVTTTADAPGTNRFEISLDGGKLVSEDDKLYMWKNEMSERQFSATNTIPFGCPKAEFTEVETDGQNEQHVGVLNAFAGKILRGTPLIAEGYEGLNGLTISNAMHLSAWLGKPVEIPFDDELFYEELMKRVKTSRRKEGVEAVYADTAGTYNSK
ncbi:MAG TPA: Gfo/Idh/MocA family oxidoreductase [Candidatus Merdivicinus excrementipullorum]|mgnify:FL=1|uniref:Gfo/Idh/MocA family oxidoreductase n=1 Tax=Candidatus Merdivicinus excrementipullorum TaxID=2840867 RepID=A0A9D1FLJ6_9FIRM|nr:Gfo/Idh/MocA family oxidoreductase [Candidatus Merdivicinus excrementipullorum]